MASKKKVFVLKTAWKDGDYEVDGVFSKFEYAVSYFVRIQYMDATMSVPEMQAACARAALKLAGETDDEDRSDFGDVRACIEEHVVDEHCELFETEAGA